MDKTTIKQAPPAGGSRRKDDLYLCLVHPARPSDSHESRVVRVGSGVVVGRDPSGRKSVKLNDGTVSRSHFRILREGRSFTIEDLNSSNGTYLNGKRVRKSAVEPQDVVRSGGTLFVLTSRPPGNLSRVAEYGIIGTSRPLMEAVELVESTMKDDANVLFLGETGTGKDLFSKFLHEASGRTGRFLQVNCAAIPEQLLESTLFGSVKGAYTGSEEDRVGLLVEAHGGTLLLDEIGELHEQLQVKLLRTIEDRYVVPVGSTKPVPFDVKLLAATNRAAFRHDEVKGFRQDLLARLEDVVIELPPLRHRREDIVLLLESLLSSTDGSDGQEYSLDFVESILLYGWPRNVRQLLKVVKKALRRTADGLQMTAAEIEEPLEPERLVHADQGKLPRKRPPVAPAARRRHRRPAPPEEAMRTLFSKHDGNVSAMARELRCDRKQIYRWLEKYSIEHDGGSLET